MERRFHSRDFAIERDQQTPLARLDPRFRYAKNIEIFRLIDSPKKRVKRQPEKAEASGPMAEIQAKFAGVHAGAGTEIEAGDLVFIVADEKKGGPAKDLLAFENNPQIQKRKTAHRLKSRPEKRRPLAARETVLLRFAAGNNLGINPEVGIVDENPAVHFTHVHGRDFSLCERSHRLLQIERDAQVLREMVQRADRQHSQNLVLPGQFCRDRANRSVATSRDNDPFAVLRCFARHGGDVRAVARVQNPGRFAVCLEQLDNARLRIVRTSRPAIHDHDHRTGIVSVAASDAFFCVAQASCLWG